MCRALKVLCVAPDAARLQELKMASVGASWELSPAWRERTLIVWVLWATAYFVTNSLNNWMPSLYSTIYHLPLQQSLRAASMTNVAQVAVLLVCAFCIDRIGRRTWTMWTGGRRTWKT